MTLFLALAATLLVASCATMGPPQPPSLELPKPPTDLRAARKGNRVTLTWTIPTVTTDRQTIRNEGPTWICRGLGPELTQCGVPLAETPPQPGSSKTGGHRGSVEGTKSGSANSSESRSKEEKVTASYTGLLPEQLDSGDPSASITYAIEALNPQKRGAGLSNQVQVPLLATAPPPGDFRGKLTKQGVALQWNRSAPTQPQTQVHYAYRIYRRLAGSTDWAVAGELPAGGENDTSLTDSNIEWEKTYEYRAVTVTVVDQNGKPAVRVEGDDSADVKIFADDVFPPAVPTGLQAVFSGPGQAAFIDLVWAPVTDIDLNGYNVYRHEEGNAAVKLNSQPVKTPAFRDTSVVAGRNYFYSVTAVDVRGNESARSEEASERVP